MLPSNEHQFHVKVQGEKTKEWFEGNFTTKILLTNEESIDVAIRTDRYNRGSMTLATQYALLNRTIAELEVRIIKNKEGKTQAPTWWVESDGGRLLMDSNIVYHVFNETMKGEQEWVEKLDSKIKEEEKKAKDSPRKAE